MTKAFQYPVLSDEEIANLIAEPKPAPANWRSRLDQVKEDGAQLRARIHVAGVREHEFMITRRQSMRQASHFSVILTYVAPKGERYNLVRCNGPHPSWHHNRIEGERFPPCHHVHWATERYQHAGLKVEGFAEQSEEFGSVDSAIDYLAWIVSLNPEGGMQARLGLGI